MAFTFSDGNNPIIDYPRLLIPDFIDNPPDQPAAFTDGQILAFYQILASQYQSSMFFSGPAYRNLPQQPVSYLRVAAYALQSLAGQASKVASVTKLLDVSLSPKEAAAALAQRSKDWLEIDDNAGAFAIVEQVCTGWAFQNRFWNQIARQTGGGAF